MSDEVAAAVEPRLAVVTEGAPAAVPELPAPAAAETAAAAPVAEAAPAETAPAATEKAPSLLERASAAEPPPAAEPAAQVAAEAPAATYEPFALPEGVAEDAAAMERFTGLLAEHKLPQEAGQALIDLYGQEAQRFATQMREQQVHEFEATKARWVETIEADRDLGGAHFDTTLRQAAAMRDLLIPPEHRAEFNDFLTYTGAGDHPAIFRLLVNAHRLLGEPTAPPPAAKPAPAPRGAAGARQGGASRLRDFYNPGR